MMRWMGMMAVTLSAGLLATTAAEARERLNPLVERLAAGEAAFGIFSGSRDLLNAARLADSGLDYVIIDMEHAPYDVETLRRFILAMKNADGAFPVAPLVRIPANGREVRHNQWMVKQVLDAGAMGVVVPHVNSAEEARDAVVAMRYPPPAGSPAPEPRGVRGWGPLAAANAWGVDYGEYARRADLWPLNPEGELILVVQIETFEAVADAASILAVPGVGAAFVGPADLHADMGHLGQSGVPAVEEAIQQAAEAATEAEVPTGITTSAETVAERVEQGFRMPTVGFDLAMPAGIAEALEAVGR